MFTMVKAALGCNCHQHLPLSTVSYIIRYSDYMCELFGVCSSRRVDVKAQLKEFFSHSEQHCHGWGMATFYGDAVSLEKEPLCANRSQGRPVCGQQVQSAPVGRQLHVCPFQLCQLALHQSYL
ncbi:MAG: class II glutamine amidotransferase [Prevotella sp.]